MKLSMSNWDEKAIFYAYCCMFFFLPIATTPGVVASTFAVLIWILSGKFIKDIKTWPKQSWFVPACVMILIPWIGLIYTEDIKTGLKFARKTHYWVLALIANSLVSHKGSPINVFLKLFIAGLSLTSILSLFQSVGILPLKKGECLGLFSSHIPLSLLLVFGLLVTSFYFKQIKEMKHKILSGAAMGLFFLSLMVVRGRIGYLSFILLSPILTSNILKRKNILKTSLISILLITILFASPAVQERVILGIENVKEYKTGNPNTSLGHRFYMWQVAFKIFLENPVVGAGTGAYMSETAKRRNMEKAKETGTEKNEFPKVFKHPHNSYLYMAANHGIIGLTALIWLFTFLLKKAWKFRSSLLGFSICSATAILTIASLTDTQIIQVQWGMLLALFTGFSGRLEEKNEKI